MRTSLRQAVVSIFGAAVLSGQSLAAPAEDAEVLAMLKARVEVGQFPGVVVGLVSRDGKRRVIAYGPTAGVQPFDGNTVFEIGSITKVFTASILADQVQKHEVALEDPVAMHLPAGTTVPRRDGKQITLLDLATQRSGLPGLPTNFAPADPENPYRAYTSEQLFAFLASYELPRGIGEAYEYSNLGVGLLGQALSHRAKLEYEALVTQRVLTPLGMKDTAITLSASQHERLAPGHSADGAPAKNWDFPTFAGAGALRSTANDLLRFVAANANAASKPLGATLAMTHGERAAGPRPSWALGLLWNRLRAPSGHVVVWHNGGTGGYRSFLGYDETTGLGVVVLTNTAESVDELGLHLLDGALPLPPAPLALPESALERLVGAYELAPNFTITITREGRRLFAQATAQPRLPLFAKSENEFFLRVVDAQVTFVSDATGRVTSLVLHQGGDEHTGQRR